MNIKNHVIEIGNVVDTPHEATNNDGSHKILFRVAVKDNFKSKGANGEMDYQPQFIPCQKFIPAGQTEMLKLYKNLVKGQKIAVSGALKTPSYTKDGKQVFDFIFDVETIDITIEPKSVTDERR